MLCGPSKHFITTWQLLELKMLTNQACWSFLIANIISIILVGNQRIEKSWYTSNYSEEQ